MHFNAMPPTIAHNSHITGDDRVNLGLFSRINNGPHERHFLIIDDGIDREIRFDLMLMADARDIF